MTVLGVCPDCRGWSHLDGLVSLVSLENQLMTKTIHLVKYSYVADLVDCLDEVMGKKLGGCFGAGENYLLMPVPLHRRRYLKRGFNQSQLIGEALCRRFGFDIRNDILIRKINNKSQTKLLFDQRQKNVSGIFSVVKKPPRGKTIILVDDICTTGATMQECAEVLKAAGAEKVIGFALAG